MLRQFRNLECEECGHSRQNHWDEGEFLCIFPPCKCTGFKAAGFTREADEHDRLMYARQILLRREKRKLAKLQSTQGGKNE